MVTTTAHHLQIPYLAQAPKRSLQVLWPSNRKGFCPEKNYYTLPSDSTGQCSTPQYEDFVNKVDTAENCKSPKSFFHYFHYIEHDSCEVTPMKTAFAETLYRSDLRIDRVYTYTFQDFNVYLWELYSDKAAVDRISCTAYHMGRRERGVNLLMENFW